MIKHLKRFKKHILEVKHLFGFLALFWDIETKLALDNVGKTNKHVYLEFVSCLGCNCMIHRCTYLYDIDVYWFLFALAVNHPMFFAKFSLQLPIWLFCKSYSINPLHE